MAGATEYFRGHAKIRLHHLEFHSPLFASRAFDPSHVDRLKNVFQQDACARSDPCNFISAVIDDDTLDQAIIQSSTTVEALRSETKTPFLLLPNGYRLRCLYGRHRVEAAKEVLFPGDTWWSVTLYHDSKLKVSYSGLLVSANREKAFQRICGASFAFIEMVTLAREIFIATCDTASSPPTPNWPSGCPNYRSEASGTWSA
jgi:hypothetical protein